MKRLAISFPDLFFTFTIIFLIGCNHAEKKMEYGKATMDLISLVESNPQLKSMLTASIEKARQINPDRNTNPAQNLEEYYEFVSWAETAMPWTLMKKEEYPEILDNTNQGLCAFYFLIDQPVPELTGKGLVNNSLQYAEPFASWLVNFNNSWGSFLDTEASWNEEYYQMALNDPNFGLQNGWYEDPSNWKTFNEFFARRLKSPDMRPIAAPNVDSIVVSFADAIPQGIWTIDSNSNLVVKEGVAVKSSTVKSISKLIGEDSDYQDDFANGTFTHSLLQVNNYHHFHFPMSGTVREIRIIQGVNPSGGALRWDAENGRYVFNPSAKMGWQSVETRGCVILETEEYGLVALLPVGIAAIASVNFENNVKPGVRVMKGDMLGYFAFGGSDFIMILQEKVNFTLDAPKQENSNSYKPLLMGERLGYLTKK
jgi:phosphatidylserine decarboxylase